jgi:hypothetical protein
MLFYNDIFAPSQFGGRLTTIAKVLITLDEPIKGSDLIKVVKEFIANRQGDQRILVFMSNRLFDNGDMYRIGQRSGYPYEHLVVEPSDDLGIRPEKFYTDILVKDHDWGGNVYAVGYSSDTVIKAVRTFAEDLEYTLKHVPITEQTWAWPQEVTVCVICNRIVQPFGVNATMCRSDGKNPPTTKIKVVPVTS